MYKRFKDQSGTRSVLDHMIHGWSIIIHESDNRPTYLHIISSVYTNTQGIPGACRQLRGCSSSSDMRNRCSSVSSSGDANITVQNYNIFHFHYSRFLGWQCMIHTCDSKNRFLIHLQFCSTNTILVKRYI